MNVVVVAEEATGARTLRLLAGTDYRVVAVLTSASGEGRGAAVVAAEAKRLGLPTRPAALVEDPALADEMRAENVDLLINVHSLHIIHEAILATPRIGCFNLHPGPLPEYAGLDAPSWAIYRGEPEHGVTVHWMDPGIDTGAVAYETRFPIAESDNGLSLSLKCVRAGLPLIGRLLEDAAAGADHIPRIPQDLSKRRYYRRRAPRGGRIDWLRPAREIVDFVRACDFAPFPSPWGHPLTRCDGADVRLAKAALSDEPCDAPAGTVTAVDSSGARVATCDRWIVVTKLQLNGGYAPAHEVLRSGQRLGGSSV